MQNLVQQNIRLFWIFFILFPIVISDLFSQSTRAVMTPAKTDNTNFALEIMKKELGPISDVISNNIYNRILQYGGSKDAKINMSIYNYENLPPEIKKQYDQEMLNNYRVKWDELNYTDKKAYNQYLQSLGEKQETLAAMKSAKAIADYYQQEKNIYRPSLPNYLRAQVAEKFSAGLVSIDYKGDIVENSNIWGAYANLLFGSLWSSSTIGIPVTGNEMEKLKKEIDNYLLQSFGEKSINKISSLVDDKKISRKEQIDEQVKFFNSAAIGAESRLSILSPNSEGLNYSNSLTAQKNKVLRNFKNAAPTGSLYYIRGSSVKVFDDNTLKNNEEYFDAIAAVIDNEYSLLKDNPEYKFSKDANIEQYLKLMPEILGNIAMFDLSDTKYGNVILKSASANYNNDPQMARGIAQIHFQRGEKNEAVKWTNSALVNCNSCDNKTKGELLFQLGSYYLSMGMVSAPVKTTATYR